MTSPPRDIPLRALAAAVLATIAAFLVVEIYDFDIWWQVGIGRHILAQGAIPAVDQFSAAGFGRPYHDSHWLFQVVMALADRMAGMVAVQGVMLAIWGTTLWACWRGMTVGGAAHAGHWLLLLATAMACSERFLPRPEIVTYLMLALFLWRLRAGAWTRRTDLLLLMALQVLWSNSHGLFVLGPFLVGCFWLAHALRRSPATTALGRLLGGVLLATLVSPFPVAAWRYAFLLFTEASPVAPQLLKSLAELSPTFGAATRSGAAFWFYLALLLLCLALAVRALRRRELAWPEALVAATLLLLSLTGRRNMVLFALAAGPFAAAHLPRTAAVTARWRTALLAGASVVVLLWGALPLSGVYYRYLIGLPVRCGFGAMPSYYPQGFGAFAREHRLQGRIFNSNILGGYILYQAGPALLPLTDGRWEVYDQAVFPRIDAALGNVTKWDALVREYDLRGALLQHDTPETQVLLPLLREHRGWMLVYCDGAASYWVPRQVPGTPPGLTAAQVETLDAAVGRRFEDLLVLDAFLGVMRFDAPRLRLLQSGLERFPRAPELLERLGEAHLAGDKLAEAESTFRRLLEVAPKNVRAHNELAFLAYRRGDLAAATEWLRRGLALNPDDADLRANLERLAPR